MALSNSPKNLAGSGKASWNVTPQHDQLNSICQNVYIKADNGEVNIQDHLNNAYLVKVLKIITPDKMKDVANLLNWSLTNEVLKECNFEPPYLLEKWKQYCESYLREGENGDVIGYDFFLTILEKTSIRYYFSQYESILEEYRSSNPKYYFDIMALIEARREDLPPSIDFIMDDHGE
ncbi:hypothetical protein N9948_00160 [bacterium]|nr:hypothetical protein [bacterium]